MTTARRPDALVLAVDARSHGPREVEEVLRGIGEALGGQAPPTWTSTHVIEQEGLRHVGAMVWEDPPWHLDLLSIAHRGIPPGGATVCRMTRRGTRLGGASPTGTSAVVAAAHEAAAGRRGRVVTFPGQDALCGLLTVQELTLASAVDAVVGLPGTAAEPFDVVDTETWVRPRWRDGLLELLVERGAGGLLRPFEQRRQIACCAVH